MIHSALSDYILAVCILIYLIYTFANCYVVVCLFPSGFHIKLFSLLMLNNNPLPLIAIVCFMFQWWIYQIYKIYFYKFPIVILGFCFVLLLYSRLFICCVVQVLARSMFNSKYWYTVPHASLLICRKRRTRTRRKI